MKTASPALKAFVLSNAKMIRAQLFTITLLNGTVLRYCDGQTDITFGGNLFGASRSGRGAWKRGKISTKLGMESSTLDLEVIADTTDTVGSIPIIQAALLGLFDGATVRIETLLMATYGDVSNGSVVNFLGEISNLDQCGRSHAKFTVVSLTHRLDTPLPRKLIQPACSHTLFDAGCTLVKATFAVNKIIQAGSTQSLLIPSVAFSQADGYFDLGTGIFTSGANNGFTFTIKKHLSGQLQLHVPLPFAVNAGDTFTVYPGCDKLQATCNTKFSNLINFGGEPYVPVPETAL
jgi:uncharacterized phage protein (TIGR02218 family)